MIIISSISLSIMLSNNILIPYGWLNNFKTETENVNSKTIVNIRKFSIFSLIILSFIFYKYLISSSTLFSVGLIAFVLIAQLGPSFFGAIFWRRGSFKGAVAGIIAGVLICYINLIIPDYFQTTYQNSPLFTFFKLDYLSPVANVFFWSLLVNSALFMIISSGVIAHYRERNFAELYVDIDDYIQNHENAYIWKGTANISDIQKILTRF